MKNRDIVNHGASGKGDANRSPLNEAWRANYNAINWPLLDVTYKNGFVRRGGKLIKKYS